MENDTITNCSVRCNARDAPEIADQLRQPRLSIRQRVAMEPLQYLPYLSEATAEASVSHHCSYVTRAVPTVTYNEGGTSSDLNPITYNPITY